MTLDLIGPQTRRSLTLLGAQLTGALLVVIATSALAIRELGAQSAGQGSPAQAGRLARYATLDSTTVARTSVAIPRSPSADSRGTSVGAGSARLVTAGSFTVFPFGHSQPVVTCTLLRACVIELEDGETIVNEPIAGDAVRWMIERAKAGPDGRNALVVVKPRFCEITTNLVIPTDRRIYDLTLDSPPCKGKRGDTYNPQQPYARHVRFSYPDDSLAVGRPAGPGAHALANAETQTSRGGEPTAVNRAYRIVRTRRGPFGIFGHKRLDFPWKPAAMYDDGAHLYVELPAAARHQAVPVLYALERDGSRSLLNYTVQPTAGGDALFIVDRVVPRATLVLGAGGHEQRLVIENRAFGRASASGSTGQGRR